LSEKRFIVYREELVMYGLNLVLTHIIVYCVTPMLQLILLISLAFLCTIFVNRNCILIVWWLMALRWDQTGLSGITVYTLVICKVYISIWAEILESQVWFLRRKYYPQFKWLYFAEQEPEPKPTAP